MSTNNLIHFGIDPQLASLRSKLLMSFGFQMHPCSSLQEVHATVNRRVMQGCVVCQTVPRQMLDPVTEMLTRLGVPVLILSSESLSVADSTLVRYSSPAARQFLPKLQVMMRER